MVLSMTSFARRECTTDVGTLRWELRSVNHRYLDVSPRIPDDLRQLEPKVREMIGKRLNRGKVECSLRYQLDAKQTQDFAIDQTVVLRLANATQEVTTFLPNPAPLNVLDVLRWPGVLQTEEVDLKPLLESAMSLLEEALDDMVASRAREGEKLKKLIETRCDAIDEIVVRVRELMPNLRKKLRTKLEERLGELMNELEPGRLEQEIVIQAQKMDVDEELDRLVGHVIEVRRVINSHEPMGRRLDFLMQELNREANTLGSKSVDGDVTKACVDLKVLIEQIREQVQNIE